MKFVIWKPKKKNLQAQIVPQENSIKCLKRLMYVLHKQINVLYTLPENRRKGGTFQIILYSQYYSDTKTRQKQYKKQSTPVSLKNLDAELPWWSSGWKSSCQYRGHRFHWSRKILYATGRATKPMCHKYWSPSTPEPVLNNKRRHRNEKPVFCN